MILEIGCKINTQITWNSVRKANSTGSRYRPTLFKTQKKCLVGRELSLPHSANFMPTLGSENLGSRMPGVSKIMMGGRSHTCDAWQQATRVQVWQVWLTSDRVSKICFALDWKVTTGAYKRDLTLTDIDILRVTPASGPTFAVLPRMWNRSPGVPIRQKTLYSIFYSSWHFACFESQTWYQVLPTFSNVHSSNGVDERGLSNIGYANDEHIVVFRLKHRQK